MLLKRFYTSAVNAAPNRPVSLLSKVQADLKTSMLAKQKERVPALKSLLAELKYAQLSPNAIDSYAAVRKQIKLREESIMTYTQAGRQDLVEKEQGEINIIKEYLPEQMKPEEIEKVVRDLLANELKGEKNMGKVMKALGSKIDSSVAPSSVVAPIVKAVLKSL